VSSSVKLSVNDAISALCFSKRVRSVSVAIVLEDSSIRTKKPEDLEEAISLIEEIGDVSGNINIANMLHERFHTSGNPKDLDQAARIAKKKRSLRNGIRLPIVYSSSRTVQIFC